MEKIKDFLQTIGFGKNEAEVYLALVNFGDSSVLELSKHTNIHRSNIYDALRVLISQGLVFELGTPTKIFSARPLHTLNNFLYQKQIELKDLVASFENKISSNKKENNGIKSSKGLFALKEALWSLLNTNDSILAYGIPNYAPEKIGPILQEFHKERIKRKVEMKHLYNSGADERVKYLNKMKHTEAKILPSKYDSFATTNISGNKVTLFLWEPEVTVIELENESLSMPYKTYFDLLWAKGKSLI